MTKQTYNSQNKYLTKLAQRENQCHAVPV